MTAVFFDVNAIFIEGYRDSFVAGSLVADTVGTDIGIRVRYGRASQFINIEPWSAYTRQDGSLFASLAEAKAYLDGEFTKRRPLGFTFIQSEPASFWTIRHSLGFRPSVSLADTSGDPVSADARYPDADTVTITFAAPVSGTAYLS